MDAIKAPSANSTVIFSSDEKRTGRAFSGMSELRAVATKAEILNLKGVIREASDAIFGPAESWETPGGPVTFYAKDHYSWSKQHSIKIEKYINFSDGQWRTVLSAEADTIAELTEKLAIALHGFNKQREEATHRTMQWHISGC